MIGVFKVIVHAKKSVRLNLHYMSIDINYMTGFQIIECATKDGRILTLPHFITHYYFSCTTNCDCA